MACTPDTVTIDGITISTSDFVNAQELLTVSGDGGDPTNDEYEENSANGNNGGGTTGIQFPPPTQTSLPPPISQTPVEVNDTLPPGGNGLPESCPLAPPVVPIGGPYPTLSPPWIYQTVTGGQIVIPDYSYAISTNFTLGSFSMNAYWPHPIINVTGASMTDRVCSLIHLAKNVAEPLRAKYGTFRINSGIRNKNSTSSGLSQHVSGQAMDVQFSGWNYAMYWEGAQWIKDNIKYDQFIFEHSDKTGLAWYHLSYNPLGNRPATSPKKVMTMYRNNYSSGLKRMFG